MNGERKVDEVDVVDPGLRQAQPERVCVHYWQDTRERSFGFEEHGATHEGGQYAKFRCRKCGAEKWLLNQWTMSCVMSTIGKHAHDGEGLTNVDIDAAVDEFLGGSYAKTG